ncbi:hypothetical protein ES705_42426 [subsurface metagenome]
MACIVERKNKKTTNFYLVINDDWLPLGNKAPWPKSQGWKGLTQEQIERAKRKAARREVRPSPNPLLPEGKYAVICADPPWRYDFAQVTDWSIEEHYETLTTEEIKHYKDQSGVPIQDIFADNALLFLWSPQPKLTDALQVIEAWGFRYITGAVWVKKRLGMGYWWMQKHELLLLAKKGEFPTPLTKNRFPSVIEAGWNGHSTKPAVVYKMIEQGHLGSDPILEYAPGDPGSMLRSSIARVYALVLKNLLNSRYIHRQTEGKMALGSLYYEGEAFDGLILGIVDHD